MERSEGLKLLRKPFEPHQIGKLPKPTKKQTEEVRANFKSGIRCKLCGAWHHKDVVHLDYVGHAALTDRLLDSDPEWNWEPRGFDPNGLPLFDSTGGLWISLTVCGVTRTGYGNAAANNRDPGAREKEVIGDALRNAAMRFGAALDLWHKGDLHVDDEEPTPTPVIKKPVKRAKPAAAVESITPTDITQEQRVNYSRLLQETDTEEAMLFQHWGITKLDSENLPKVMQSLKAKRDRDQAPINDGTGTK